MAPATRITPAGAAPRGVPRAGGAAGVKHSRSPSSVLSITVSLQARSKDGLAPRELALDRVHRDAADGRELPVRKPVHVAEREEQTRLARDGREGALEVHTLDAAPPPPRAARAQRLRRPGARPPPA